MSTGEMRCPVCDAVVSPESRDSLPFCSERCRLIDLGRWLNEGYGLEYIRPQDDEDDPDLAGDD